MRSRLRGKEAKSIEFRRISQRPVGTEQDENAGKKLLEREKEMKKG